jgi:hypothetical protein
MCDLRDAQTRSLAVTLTDRNFCLKPFFALTLTNTHSLTTRQLACITLVILALCSISTQGATFGAIVAPSPNAECGLYDTCHFSIERDPNDPAVVGAEVIEFQSTSSPKRKFQTPLG